VHPLKQKDPMTTLATIDRVVHHVVILDPMALGSSCTEQASTQQTEVAPSTARRLAGSPTYDGARRAAIPMTPPAIPIAFRHVGNPQHTLPAKEVT